MYYQNVRGLNSKAHEFKHNILASQYPIICCTETWLQPGTCNSEFIDDNYTVFRADRQLSLLNCKRGGGVMIAVDNNYSAVEVNLELIRSNVPSIDILAVKIKINFHCFFIFAVYIPPHVDNASFSILLELLESLQSISDSEIYFIGDFNVSEYFNYTLTNVATEKVLILNSFCRFFELSQLNNVTNVNHRLLDLVLSNVPCEVVKSSDILLNEDTHHPALCTYISVDRTNSGNFPTNNNKTFNFRKANLPLLYEQLNLVDWSFIDQFNDCNKACDAFYNTVINIFNMYVPKTTPRRRKYPPWFSYDIILNIKKKTNLWKQFKRYGYINIYNDFKYLRNKIKKDVNNSYKQYIANLQHNIKQNTNKFWTFVNSKKSNYTIPGSVVFNNTECNKPMDIVNAFASFFESAFTPTNNNIQTYDKECFSSFSLPPITEKDIYCHLKRIKPNFTTGPDNIPAFIVHDCAYIFSIPLARIINLCLTSNVFPEVWKTSKVRPIYKKKGDTNNVVNYRPITIICNFAKGFEMFLHSFIYENIQGQLNIHQHGFVRGRSTITNLFCVTQYISNIVDAGGQVDVIYTDISKAFDRLDHDILLQTLAAFGFSPKLITFFTSYLTNRCQFVEYHGFKSFTYYANSGVPQGSILGPLLFIMYINSITDAIDVNCLLYADDLKIFCDINNADDCVKLQHNINAVSDWCLLNRLPLNFQKCNIMTYTKKINIIKYEYLLNNVPLERVSEFKDLGVIFDPKLTFNNHIQKTVLSAYKSLGFVIRNSYGFSDESLLLLLFNTFVKSKLEYASIIWNPGYQIYCHSVESIQRKFLKFVSFKMDHVYPAVGTPNNVLLSRFNVLSLEERRKLQSLLFLHKIINNTIDCSDILEQLNFHVPSTSIRQNLTFYLPTPRTNLLKFSPLYFMCKSYHSVQSILDIFNCKKNAIKLLFTRS